MPRPARAISRGLLGFRAKKPDLIKSLLVAGADPLAVNSEGKSIERELWKFLDKQVQAMLGQAVKEATQKQIDRICRLYSADNPQAPKAEAIEPATPNLAAGYATVPCSARTSNASRRCSSVGSESWRSSAHFTTPRKITSPSAGS